MVRAAYPDGIDWRNKPRGTNVFSIFKKNPEPQIEVSKPSRIRSRTTTFSED